MPLDTPNESLGGFAPASPPSSEHDEDIGPALSRSGKKIGGRQPGATNYSLEEIHSLLDLMQKYRPTTSPQWEALSQEYNRINQYTPRTGDNLNKKFQALIKKKRSKDGEEPPEVQLARQIAASVRSGGALGVNAGEFDAHAQAQAHTHTHAHAQQQQQQLAMGVNGLSAATLDFAEDVLRAASSAPNGSITPTAAMRVRDGASSSPLVLRKPVAALSLSSSSSSSSHAHALAQLAHTPALRGAPLASVSDVVSAFTQVLEQREPPLSSSSSSSSSSSATAAMPVSMPVPAESVTNAELLAALQSLSQDVKALVGEVRAQRERASLRRERETESGRESDEPAMKAMRV